MPSVALDRLVSSNILSHEPESRFRLAYGAVHSNALAGPRDAPSSPSGTPLRTKNCPLVGRRIP